MPAGEPQEPGSVSQEKRKIGQPETRTNNPMDLVALATDWRFLN